MFANLQMSLPLTSTIMSSDDEQLRIIERCSHGHKLSNVFHFFPLFFALVHCYLLTVLFLLLLTFWTFYPLSQHVISCYLSFFLSFWVKPIFPPSSSSSSLFCRIQITNRRKQGIKRLQDSGQVQHVRPLLTMTKQVKLEDDYLIVFPVCLEMPGRDVNCYLPSIL